MTLTELKGLVTPEGVKRALDDQIYDSLVYGDGHNVTDACSNAATWAYSVIAKVGKLNYAFTADDKEVLSAAMIQMAIYNLGAHHFFDLTNPKEAAVALLNASLGLSSDSDGTSTFTGAAVAKDEKSHIIHQPRRRPPYGRY